MKKTRRFIYRFCKGNKIKSCIIGDNTYDCNNALIRIIHTKRMELVSFYTIYSVYLVISGSLEVWKIIQFFI